MACLTDIGRQLCVDPASRLELKRQIEADGSVRNFENQVYCKDGSKKWVSINARLVRDAGGNVLYYEGTNQDITERKQAKPTGDADTRFSTAVWIRSPTCRTALHL